MSKIQTLFKKYGFSSFATYTAISIISYSSWLSAIHLGLDVDPLIKKIDDVKTYFGFEVTQNEPTDVVDSNAAISNFSRFGTSLLIAAAAHKVIFPVRIGLTAYLTPSVHRIITSRGLDKLFIKK